MRGCVRRLAVLAAAVEQRLVTGARGRPSPPSSGASSSSAATWPATAVSIMHQRLYSSDQSAISKLFTSIPHSLEYPRVPAQPADAEPSGLRRALLTLGGFYSRESRFMRAAQGLYAGAVVEQATHPALLAALDVPADFQHTHAMLSLHVWLLLTRLRAEGADGKSLSQALYDDFQSDVEARARAAGVKVRLQKALTELEKQFYGSAVAYDKAQAGGEELWAALHRNVFMLAPGKQEASAALARYAKRELACLALTPSSAVMSGNLKFSTDFFAGAEGPAGQAVMNSAAAAEPGGGMVGAAPA